ncbi:flagellar biosynthesis anti-sigma factor FlgM [Gilliamella sp. Choc4-2]|uniref:flagellar biosynthesis anti-sigma factor FlgM n=1 Tax=unclassified Gilliamella TaxID=2685620 RepID=UPI00080ECDDB|nr:flagellar biosynthesis anti-sigma factor FlgM [Gilliamella apicola]OCG31053.1 flagellar biosynthesis anti-sigma factor FlgM [Gilliamella apicola]OCG46621.1 flagellar biosynthesis anti-sigma factor FlgM [Gilliamella apicola]
MSIDATKSVINISGLLSRDVINEQQKKQTVSVQAKNNINVSNNVSLTQNTTTLLHSTGKDIDVEKIESIKQAITNGTLVIDTQKIADELIKQMLQNIE